MSSAVGALCVFVSNAFHICKNGTTNGRPRMPLMLCLVFIAIRINISLLLLLLPLFYDSTFDFVVYGKMVFKLQFHVVLMCARSPFAQTVPAKRRNEEKWGERERKRERKTRMEKRSQNAP